MNASNLKIRGASWKGHDVARLQISVGQSYHEGEIFRATCQWARENFSHVIVCVNDTLQRHNGSFEPGQKWINRNKEALDLLPNKEVFLWDHWVSHPDYAQQRADVLDHYFNDPSIRAEFDNEIMAFAKRKKPADMFAFASASRAYLIEECAAFRIMFQTDAADIYPGSSLLPCRLYKNDQGKGFTKIEPRLAVA